MTTGRLRRLLLVSVATTALALAMVGATAAPASADYGRGAQYQVEISANNVGGVPGDGVWLWIALNADGSADYAGATCIHTGSLLGHPGLNGASSDRGDGAWTDTNGQLTISGVLLLGGTLPVTIVVPDAYGHYVRPSDSVITTTVSGFAIGGTAQVQVAR
jgi:hypothetical protein